MKKILFILALYQFSISGTKCLFAQISEGGTPVSFKFSEKISRDIPEAVMPSFNLDSLKSEDEINDMRKDIPWRFGYNFPVTFNLNNSGIWETIGKGARLWRLKISSKNAVSINIIFGEYFVPEGGKVFIYNENKTQILGAFTEKNNLPHRQLGVDLINADAIIIEYYEPESAAGKAALMIEQVIHGYRGAPVFTKDFGSSGSCNNNVICPEGAPWEDQIRATAMNLVNGNTWCSGAMINNTCQDGTPYYLTANHCISGSVANWVFRFNYESPVCAPSQDGPYNFTVSGATLKAQNGGSDFALLELSSAPPSNYNVYYAGWDRSGNIPSNQTGIHHPAGDVKKITFDYDSAGTATWQSAQVWEIGNWEDGTTEGGSSGSPLFDQDKRIIGQLYGGSASCSNITDDNYGRFDISWDAGGTPSTQLKDWLDMCNTAQVTIDGYEPNASNFVHDAATQSVNGILAIYCGSNTDSIFPYAIIKNKGTDTLIKATVIYGLNGASDSITWNGSLSYNSTDTVFFTSMLPSTSGEHIFSVTVINPNDSVDQNNVNDTKSVSFKYITQSQNVFFTLKTDNYGSETSWQLNDTTGSVWYSGGGYNDVNGGQTINDTFCLATGCYNFIINDSYGDGMSGLNGTGTQGTYFFQNEDGDTIANIIQVDFGDQETNNFCIQGLSAEINPLVTIQCSGNCDGALKATASAGFPPYSFLWSNNDTTDTVSGLCAGVYSVTVTDISGTSNSVIYNITEPLALSVSAALTNATFGNCNGSATVAPSGGTSPYSYQWSNAKVSPSIDSLCPGDYFITVSDSNGCSITDSINITETIALNITIASDINCNGECNGSLQANPLGGTAPYTYQWSANTVNQVMQTATGLCADTFSVTVSDANGKVNSASFVLSQPQQLFINITFQDDSGDCSGIATVGATGGTPLYFYLWSNGKTTNEIDSLCSAFYSVTITDNAGCEVSDSVFISEYVGGREQDISGFIFRIYPNPANENITITANRGDKIIIFDVTGRTILSKPVTDNPVILFTGELDAGIYYITLYGNNLVLGTQKLIIVK